MNARLLSFKLISKGYVHFQSSKRCSDLIVITGANWKTMSFFPMENVCFICFLEENIYFK